MQGDDIREQIEALREEVRSLNDSILNLRQEDMRQVYGDQVRSVLLERIERQYRPVARPGRSKDRASPTGEFFIELVERSIEVFQREGRRSAVISLDASEAQLRARIEKEEDEGELRFGLDLIAQMRQDLEVSQHVFSLSRPVAVRESGDSRTAGALTPEVVERLLSPLANAKRMEILFVLTQESSRLADLSRALDLQKGHLQFHLKALMEAGYIGFDRKSFLYTITPRGGIALQHVRNLTDALDRN